MELDGRWSYGVGACVGVLIASGLSFMQDQVTRDAIWYALGSTIGSFGFPALFCVAIVAAHNGLIRLTSPRDTNEPPTRNADATPPPAQGRARWEILRDEATARAAAAALTDRTARRAVIAKRARLWTGWLGGLVLASLSVALAYWALVDKDPGKLFVGALCGGLAAMAWGWRPGGPRLTEKPPAG